MGAVDMMIQNAFKLLLAQMPPDAPAQLAKVLQTGVELEERLGRIENSVREIRSLLVSLIEALQHRQGVNNVEQRPEPAANPGADTG